MQPSHRPAHPPLRVLLVEDNPDGRESLQQLLTLLGHDVTAVADAEAGLGASMELRPDVAIIDINLPHMNGCQLAGHLRRTLGESVRLIAYTAYDAAETNCHDAGVAAFNDWVVKPAELPKLLSRLGGERPIWN